MEYNVYQDYFNLASQIVKNMEQTKNPAVGHDFMMMEHYDVEQESLGNIDSSLDTSDDDMKLEDFIYTKASARKGLRADSPLWFQFDNGDSFFSLDGKFPSTDDLMLTEEGSSLEGPTDQCPLPYPKDWRPSPSYHDQNSPGSSRLLSRRPLLQKLSLEDLQYQGAVGNGLVNPQRPVLLDEKSCVLCKKNGETREFYTTHVLKDNRGKIICPILRKYVCPTCGATGDRAHTLRHCPVNKNAYNTGATGDHAQTLRHCPVNKNVYNPRYFYQ